MISIIGKLNRYLNKQYLPRYQYLFSFDKISGDAEFTVKKLSLGKHIK